MGRGGWEIEKTVSDSLAQSVLGINCMYLLFGEWLPQGPSDKDRQTSAVDKHQLRGGSGEWLALASQSVPENSRLSHGVFLSAA
jgi:hypothetical protein